MVPMDARNGIWRRLFPLTLASSGILTSGVAAQDLILEDGALWTTCTGVFYDSGGPAGNYGVLQELTATICPAAGAGSGVPTVVHFNVFEVGSALDLGDELVIHDGTSTSGTVLAVGNFNNSLAAQTFTASNPEGCLTFHWSSGLLGTAGGWVAQVITGPEAGSNSSITICSDQPPFALIDMLNGDPDIGGDWTGPEGPQPPIYDPAIHPSGTYTYLITDPGGCQDSATVSITKVLPPDAGGDGSILLCDQSEPVQLINSLSGTPGPGGSWSGPLGAHDGSFDPSTDPPGVYMYTIPGTTPCMPASASVSVFLTGLADAGTDGAAAVCDTLPSLGLINLLGGTPDQGGVWFSAAADTIVPNGVLSTIGMPAGEHVFRYETVVAGCGGDTAWVTLQVADGVQVIGLMRTCDASSGTSLVQFTITGGTPSTYMVTGLEGALDGSGGFTSQLMPDSIALQVIVSDANDCGPVIVQIDACGYLPRVDIPESFSPNGDGVNETFLMPGLSDFPGNEVTIYNRWSREVYRIMNYHLPGHAWTGHVQNDPARKELPAGTYFYVLDLGGGNGMRKGFVQLVR